MLLCVLSGRAEVILQYFETGWSDIAARMPELAEAGYTALWLPPPFKAGAGRWSVGFDTFDRFDIGSKDQMGSVRTKYGEAEDLLELMETAHRFGIRVYFDNVMAHNGGPIPGYDEYTPITVQPGFVPEDFHLKTRSDGTYRKMPDYPDWQDEWQVLNRNPFGLDIAHENPNTSFGAYEGATFPKYSGVRHPDNPELYLDTDLPVAADNWGNPVYTFANKEPFEDVGYGAGNTGAGNGVFDWDDADGDGQHDAGETSEPFTDTGIDPTTSWRQNATWGYGDGIYNMGNPVAEDVNGMLFRMVRWFVDTCHVDGFRLDAVKHVPYYFFGQTTGDKDPSNWGYCGQIQEQFNVTHGYSDWNNHRDTVFSTDNPRDDAMLYGEHLGSPPWEQPYLDAGMRIANNDLYNWLTYACAGWGSLNGLDAAGAGTYGVDSAVMYSGSHDYNFISTYDRPSAHALLLTRAGLPIIYTDGYNETDFAGSDGKYFPQHGDNPFLGQFGDPHLLNLLYINQLFARGEQRAKWSDDSYVAYERLDWRETGDEGNAVILAFMMARNGAGGQARGWTTTFAEGARLKNYAYHGGSFYVNVSGGQLKDDGGNNPVVPEGGYFAFSWRVPEMPSVWDDGAFAEVKPITILQNGEPVGTVLHERTDGWDGDPDFNPYGVAGDTPGDYSYKMPIPRVTSGTNLSFVCRADGSANNIMIKLDAGMDMNGQSHAFGDGRDKPPAVAGSWDMILGYEYMDQVYRIAEKCAAKDVGRNVIGTPGAETYVCTVGSSGFTVNNGGGVNFADNRAVTWAYHDPENVNELATPTLQFDPAPQDAAGSNVTVWVKVGYNGEPDRVFFYYTTNGVTWPEGSGGKGKDETQVVAFEFDSLGGNDGTGDPDWWKAELPAFPAGTELRYKIGVCKDDAADIFPFSSWDHQRVKPMETVFEITNFNAETVSYHPHGDYGPTKTGLEEGLHVVRSKAFINRGGAASIYNLNVQTFYYDALRPQGEIIYPASDGDDLYGSSYGAVVRGDRQIEQVLYRISDSQSANDDTNTSVNNGNGAWVEAVEVDPNASIDSVYPREWRFDYVNIPASGSAVIEVRLREATSSTNMSLSDVDGHFTTLTRTVDTFGPDYSLFIRWPQTDGDVVSPGYVMKALFSADLGNDISSNDLVNCFTLRVDTTVQARAEYQLIYNEQPGYHALAFTLPNLYNGHPDDQHLLEVDFSRDGYPALDASRLVLAEPVDTPYVYFVTPPVADAYGNPYEIVLEDTFTPNATQRQVEVYIETSTNALAVDCYITLGTGTMSAVAGNPEATNNLSGWHFTWQLPLTNDPAVIERSYELRADVDTDGDTNTVEAYAIRETRVVLREMVNVNTNDLDDDDDGIPDFDEGTGKALPDTASTEWVNSDVHAWYVYGKTDALSPDSDGDGLPDGLESGWRQVAVADTDTNADTDVDGYPNFISDLDPPFYNTADNYTHVPGVDAPENGNKTDLKAGTTTDPNNPDSDYDGLPDGVEDANRNGWVDGDGESIPPDWDPWAERDWPDRSLDGGDGWTETDPNNADTDGDQLSDGYWEDTNANGRVDGDLNTNRIYDAGEAWSETDPLNRDTDGDGMFDGWEQWNNLDPLDDGADNLRTALANDGDPVLGPDGDPDSDGIINIAEMISGTNPWVYDTGEPPPEGDITIGTGVAVTVGTVLNRNDFTDWTYEHLIALDPYAALESTDCSGDVYYRSWASDGLERSRDLVAFYAHDGGASGDGGDDTLYFRVDMHDLQANAEDSGLDIYVVIDTGNPDVGEKKVLDDVDVLTAMRWEVVVYVDDWNNTKVYVNHPGSWDTDTLADMMVFAPDNVEVRDRNHPSGFKKVWFNAAMDAVEFSISRQALLDAGWAGDFANLNFQVFTTRDDTGNDPVGAGDLNGPDIQDCIRTDWIAEDYACIKDGNVDQLRYEARIQLDTLYEWVGMNADNDRGKRIKVLPLVHGSQHILPGNRIQDLVNNGTGAGYYRVLDPHDAYGVPVTMHITPTLASAIEWARVDTNEGPSWKDGPALNDRIATMAATGTVVLTGSTFSDHMLPYFTQAFNSNNVALAKEFLAGVYGPAAVSEKVFWASERLLDDDVLAKVAALGYTHTFMDQQQHLRRWFGFSETVGENAYRINMINNVGCFVINDKYAGLRFSVHDGGPSIEMREVLNRRARSGQWDSQHPQILTLQMDWEEFGDNSKADAYDDIIGWMASRGWIEIVSPDAVVNGQIDISTPPDGSGDAWNTVWRGTGLSLEKTGHDWIQYSAQGNYDNWYMGSDLNEGLNDHTFDVRSGTAMPDTYGMLYYGGVVSNAWDKVMEMSNPESRLGKLARGTLHASVFKTAYHDQSQDPVNMTKFSVGEFAYPDDSWDGLSGFAKDAQAQTRMASVFARVDQWSVSPVTGVVTSAEDVDLDGENEYLLYNDRLFGLFEAIGGRLVGVWVRNPLDGEVFQAAGNLLSYAGSETEAQGDYRVDGDGNLGAYRMACLSDWWATRDGGTAAYINDLYAAVDRTNGWRFTSSDGAVQKTITLEPGIPRFEVSYVFSGVMAGEALYVRHGLSPNLYDLMLHGQANLGEETHAAGVMLLSNVTYEATVSAELGYGDPGHGAGFNATALDDDPALEQDFATVPMRNLAQTHQVEVVGTNGLTFSLGFRAVPSDDDGDGIPNVYEDSFGFLDAGDGADGAEDWDGDGSANADEYIAGTSPDDETLFPMLGHLREVNGVALRFDAASGRRHYIWYRNGSLTQGDWILATPDPIRGYGAEVIWTDDGSLTDPDPADTTNRFYRIEYQLDL
jgi:hypothetical protein